MPSVKPNDMWRAAKGRFATFEPVVVVTFLIASISGFLFLTLLGEILEGETYAFDETILKALRVPEDLGTPIGPDWLTKAVTDLTSLGGVTVLGLVTVLAVIYLLLIGKRITGLFLLCSVVGGWMVSNAFKLGVARPRPDLVPHLVEVYDLSFPSGHAMVSAVTYLTLGLLLARMQTRRAARYYFVAAAVLLTLLIGMSRIYLGVHYPTDILGGWSAGAAWACLCWLIGLRVIPVSERPAIRDSE
ncbi:phosphatase PAP2 family protein [Rhizobium sp.]